MNDDNNNNNDNKSTNNREIFLRKLIYAVRNFLVQTFYERKLHILSEIENA